MDFEELREKADEIKIDWKMDKRDQMLAYILHALIGVKDAIDENTKTAQRALSME